MSMNQENWLKIKSDPVRYEQHKLRNRVNAYRWRGGQKAAHLKHRYNLSLESYFTMLEKQQNKCAICDRRDNLHIDHCHKTGFVRGLLCRECNTGIGKLKESPKIFERALQYLQQNG